MQLISALAKSARQVETKYGQRTVIEVTTDAGEPKTIWRPANDPASKHIVNGSRLQVAIDSKGKASLIEAAASREISPSVAPKRPMGFQEPALPFEAERKLRQQLKAVQPVPPAGQPATHARIAELASIYSQCLAAANGSEQVAIEIFKAATQA